MSLRARVSQSSAPTPDDSHQPHCSRFKVTERGRLVQNEEQLERHEQDLNEYRRLGASAVEMARGCERAAMSRTAFGINAPRRRQRAEPPEAEGERGRKKMCLYCEFKRNPAQPCFSCGIKRGACG